MFFLINTMKGALKSRLSRWPQANTKLSLTHLACALIGPRNHTFYQTAQLSPERFFKSLKINPSIPDASYWRISTIENRLHKTESS